MHLPMGSATLKMVQQTGEQFIFNYTREVEGGFAVYRLKISVADGFPWVSRRQTDKSAGFPDGTLGIQTSFDPAKGEVIEMGNLLNGQRQIPSSAQTKSP